MDQKTHAHFAALAARVAQARDREAFAELFDHFAPRLNGYLQRLGTDIHKKPADKAGELSTTK